MAGARLVYRPILDADRAFLVQSNAALTWDDDPTATGDGIDALALKIAALAPDRIVVLVHGYNNPAPVAQARAERAWRDYFAGADEKTVFLAFLWPSEGGFGRGVWAVTGVTGLSRLLAGIGAALALAGLIRWSGLALLGGGLLGFVGYLVGLRFAAYYRDAYRATEYGVPDLVEAIRALDAKLRELGGDIELSFVGHSMGAFVVTSAVRIMAETFHHDLDDDRAIPDADRRAALGRVGDAFRLANLVLVSPDIPVQALVSTRVNFLAASLGRFTGRFLFSNAGDVVLDPISTTANSPVLPVRGDLRNARLGNVAVLPEDGRSLGGFFEAVPADVYDLRLRTPHGPVREVVATQPGKPRVPLAPGNAFMVFDCTGVQNPSIAHRNGLRFGLPARLAGLAAYASKRVDVHSGYFDHPDLVRAIYGAAEFGLPMRRTGATLPDWAARVGTRVLALRGEAQVDRACGGEA